MQTIFTDVGESAWFSGYVKYCQSVGIVSGRSKTIFDPNAKVTGVEAALMCLRVMGYDPAKAGIGGSSWSMTTIGLADENGLLDERQQHHSDHRSAASVRCSDHVQHDFRFHCKVVQRL